MHPDNQTEDDRRAKTSEHLRLVLPLLSMHGSDFGPHSYALWFSYVEGEIPKLVEDLDKFVRAGERLSVDQTGAIYNLHLRDAEAKSIEDARDTFGHLLTQIASSTSQVEAAARQSQSAIETMPPATTAESILQNSGKLSKQSQLVSASLIAFSQQLESAQAQVNELRDELQNVRNEARIDALTGLKNRRAFDEELAQYTGGASKDRMALALIMIDVDHFKKFNDEMGHVMGDKALRTVAAALQNHLKDQHFAARYGGEEFAVLLAGTSLVNAQNIAESLRQAVERIRIRKVATGDAVRGITVSCGVATLMPGDAMTDIVDRADTALYVAKQEGRNRVRIAPEDQSPLSQARPTVLLP